MENNLLGISLVLAAVLGIGSAAQPPAVGGDAATDVQDTAALEKLISDMLKLYVVPAPYSVALMGQLLVRSGEVEFSLNGTTPLGGFRYLRHPNSFRASVVQMSNAAWDSFHSAFATMETLQREVGMISRQIKLLPRIIKEVRGDRKERMIRTTMNVIRVKGHTCLMQVNQTYVSFGVLMNLTQELTAASVAAGTTREEQHRKASNHANVSAQRVGELSRTSAVLDRKQESLNVLVRDTRRKHQEASTPISPFLQFVRGIASLFTGGNDNEEFKADLAKRNMDQALQESAVVFEQRMSLMQRLRSLVGELAQTKLDVTEHKQVVELIRGSMELFGLLQEQWASLMGFFSGMVNHVDDAIKHNLFPHLTKLNESIPYSDYFLSLLEHDGGQAQSALKLIGFLSKTYADVHRSHIRPQLDGAASLLNVPAKKRDSTCRRLERSASSAEGLINDMVEKGLSTHLAESRDEAVIFAGKTNAFVV